MSPRLRTLASAVCLLVTLALAYGGDVGRGFIKDDFRWVRETRVRSAAEAADLFTRSDGFYRPAVAASFAMNSAAAGTASRPYGLTNLFLLSLNAGLVWWLARRLSLGDAPALVAAGAWAFNFHGINMAVLWICGRTALMVTLGALVAANAFLSGRTFLALLGLAVALLSREDAVLLPVLFAAWAAFDAAGTPSARAAAAARRTWPLFALLLPYLALRLQTSAFWPDSAPSYYQLSFSPAVVAGNLVQYADRSMTWPAVAAILVTLAAGRRFGLEPPERRAILFGLTWLVITFALTILVPVRSSLYAVLPSVGAALAAGGIVAAAVRVEPRRAGRALPALLLLPVLLLPVYWSRNQRWVRLGELSTTVLAQAEAAAVSEPGRPLMLIDAPAQRFTLDAAFGSLWPDAVALFLPANTRAEIVATAETDGHDAIVFRLAGDRLQRVR